MEMNRHTTRDIKMKITKSQFKQLIKEEIQFDHALLDAINSLGDRIEDLDVSIDYLAASMTGGSAAALGYGQAALGRFARGPRSVPVAKAEVSELKQIIQEELEGCLGESDYVSNIYKWCPTGSKCAPQKQKTKWWKGR